MYAYSRKSALPGAVDFVQEESDEEFFYWRKHPNLHGWMQRLYREKGGTDRDFNLVPVALTEVDLRRLEKALDDDALTETTGFFFGQSSSEDEAEDRRFLVEARARLAAGQSIYYSSWW
jgi:hypothetical protein